MSKETIGVVQYMTNKGTWENVPLYKEDNKLVDLWIGGKEIYDYLQEYCYNLESSDATALSDALGFYEDGYDTPDWKAVHLATLKYLASKGVRDMVKLSDKIETITELAGVYASLDLIRFVYYLDY
jgi:hypothetical protein